MQVAERTLANEKITLRNSPDLPKVPSSAIPHSSTSGMRSHNGLNLSSLFLLLWCGCGTAEEPTILIGAFNVRKFGVPKVQNPAVLNSLVKIIRRYDVLAISEITDRTDQVMGKLMTAVNANSTTKFEYGLTGRVGRSKNKEQYALIYRVGSVEVKKFLLFDDSPGDPFTREPLVAHLRLRHSRGPPSDLALISVHTKPSDAAKEIDALVEVVAFAENTFNTKGVIVIGDLNADCSYVRKRDWENIRLWTDKKFKWLIGDVDTTVTKTHCAYDRIVVSGSELSKRVRKSSVFHFDLALGLSETEALAVSDHYPVEVGIVGRPSLFKRLFGTMGE